MSATTTAATLADLKARKAQLMDEVRHHATEAGAKAQQLQSVLDDIAALEAPANGPEPERRSTSVGVAGSSQGITITNITNITHVYNRSQSHSRSPDAPPRESSYDRWVRKQFAKEDAKQELFAVQHRGRRQREMARDELEDRGYGRGRGRSLPCHRAPVPQLEVSQAQRPLRLRDAPSPEPEAEAIEFPSEESEEEVPPQARRSPRLRGEPALEPEPEASSSAKRG